MVDSDILEIKRLYLDEKLSSYGVARKIGIPTSTVKGKLKELGISRNHSEATKIQKQRREQPGFLCRLCGKKKPIDELVVNKRYFPPIPCCEKCAGY